jgi:FkbM family methyltransferase
LPCCYAERLLSKALLKLRLETMAIVRNQYSVPDPFLSSEVKDFLERHQFGRLGLRVGRKFIQMLRKWRDPVQRKLWTGRFSLRVRNVVLLNRPLTVTFSGIPISLVPRGAVAADLWVDLRSEEQEVSFILSVLEPGMIFFDVGTNAGVFAISAAKKIGGNGVFAFEPCSSTCALLKRNLELNRLGGVHVVQSALGDSVGVGMVQINVPCKDGLNTLGQATHPGSKVIGLESVRITTVDAFMKDHKIPRVNVLKVAIEGAELMMFRGARELLERADAPIILYEGSGFLTRGFGYHPVEILWFLESCGYFLFSLSSETGQISELKADYQYDSMVIAVKPGHPAYAKLQASLK